MRAGHLFIVALPFFGLGCASNQDGMEKRLASLRDDITRLQADNDRLVERVDALETRPTRAPAPATAPAEKVNSRAPLKVVTLTPDDVAAPMDDAAPQEVAVDDRPDAPGSRPVIRVRGKAEEDGRSRTSVRKSSPEEAPQ